MSSSRESAIDKNKALSPEEKAEQAKREKERLANQHVCEANASYYAAKHGLKGYKQRFGDQVSQQDELEGPGLGPCLSTPGGPSRFNLLGDGIYTSLEGVNSGGKETPKEFRIKDLHIDFKNGIAKPLMGMHTDPFDGSEKQNFHFNYTWLKAHSECMDFIAMATGKRTIKIDWDTKQGKVDLDYVKRLMQEAKSKGLGVELGDAVMDHLKNKHPGKIKDFEKWVKEINDVRDEKSAKVENFAEAHEAMRDINALKATDKLKGDNPEEHKKAMLVPEQKDKTYDDLTLDQKLALITKQNELIEQRLEQIEEKHKALETSVDKKLKRIEPVAHKEDASMEDMRSALREVDVGRDKKGKYYDNQQMRSNLLTEMKSEATDLSKRRAILHGELDRLKAGEADPNKEKIEAVKRKLDEKNAGDKLGKIQSGDLSAKSDDLNGKIKGIKEKVASQEASASSGARPSQPSSSS